MFGTLTIKGDGSIDAGKGVKMRTCEFMKYLLAPTKLKKTELDNVKAEYNKAFRIDVDDLGPGQKVKDLPEIKYV